MSIKVYVNGCMSCGKLGAMVLKLKSAMDVTIVNSKYDELGRVDHLEYLKRADMDTSQYRPIVVEDDGRTITLLEEWVKTWKV